MIEVLQKLREKQYPAVVSKCIRSLGSDIRLVKKITYDPMCIQMKLELEKFYIERYSIIVWANMRLFYGFNVYYLSEEDQFKIGGYETPILKSKTLRGLLSLLNRVMEEDTEDD